MELRKSSYIFVTKLWELLAKKRKKRGLLEIFLGQKPSLVLGEVMESCHNDLFES